VSKHRRDIKLKLECSWNCCITACTSTGASVSTRRYRSNAQLQQLTTSWCISSTDGKLCWAIATDANSVSHIYMH